MRVSFAPDYAMLRRCTFTLILLTACGPGTSSTDDSGDTGDTAPTATGEATATATADTGDATSTVTSASSVGTSDSTATTGADVCPDELPQDGTPCDAEGRFCGGPCDDPCSFCNVIRCEQGTWMGLEVFPADCLDCETACTFVLPAACSAGPPDQATCISGCMDVQAGDCGLVYNQALACMGSMPVFLCNTADQPSVEACAAQFDALYACLG